MNPKVPTASVQDRASHCVFTSDPPHFQEERIPGIISEGKT